MARASEMQALLFWVDIVIPANPPVGKTVKYTQKSAKHTIKGVILF